MVRSYGPNGDDKIPSWTVINHSVDVYGSLHCAIPHGDHAVNLAAGGIKQVCTTKLGSTCSMWLV